MVLWWFIHNHDTVDACCWPPSLDCATHLRFYQFPKNAEVCRVGYVLFIKPWHHTLHISELKYANTYGTFPSFLEIDKTAGAYSLQIWDYLTTARGECISANSQIAHRRTAIFWLPVTSSRTLFLHRIEESSQPSVIL